MSLEAHIEMIRRQQGWQAVNISEDVWTSQEWQSNPVKDVKAVFVVIEFFSWHSSSATPDGLWKFSGAKNSSVYYDRSNCEVKAGAAAGECALHSHRISVHEDQLIYSPQNVEPHAYTWIRYLKLTRG